MLPLGRAEPYMLLNRTSRATANNNNNKHLLFCGGGGGCLAATTTSNNNLRLLLSSSPSYHATVSLGALPKTSWVWPLSFVRVRVHVHSTERTHACACAHAHVHAHTRTCVCTCTAHAHAHAHVYGLGAGSPTPSEVESRSGTALATLELVVARLCSSTRALRKGESPSKQRRCGKRLALPQGRCGKENRSRSSGAAESVSLFHKGAAERRIALEAVAQALQREPRSATAFRSSCLARS
jgi:hypothetical protein